MDYESLSNLKYAELLSLAKSKLGITKRQNKEKLIQKLLKAVEDAEQSTDHSSVENHGDSEISTKSSPSKDGAGENFQPEQASSPVQEAEHETEVEKPTKAPKSKRRGAKRAKNAKKETEPTESPQKQAPDASKDEPKGELSKVALKESPKHSSPVVVIKRLSSEEAATVSGGGRTKKRKRRRGTVKKVVNEEQSPKTGNEPPCETASPPRALTLRSSPRFVEVKRSSSSSSKIATRTSPRKLNGTFEVTEPSPVTSPAKSSSGAEEKASDGTFEVRPTPPTRKRAQKRTLSEETAKGSILNGTFEVSPTSTLSSKRRKMTDTEQPPATPSARSKRKTIAEGKPAANLATPSADKRLVAKTPGTRQRPSHIPRFVNYVKQREEEQNASDTRSQKKTTRAAPNFAEIHQRQFDKMESVNDYVSKKQRRLATLTASTVKARSVAQQTQEVMDQVKKRIVRDVTFDKRKSNAAKTDSAFQPVLNLTDVKLNFASGSSLKSPKFTAKGAVAQHKQTTVEALGRSPGKVAKTKLAKPVSKTSPRKSTQKSPAHKGLRKPTDSKGNNNKSLLSASLHDSRLAQRTIIKGVRTNRRFELQMQRRGLL